YGCRYRAGPKAPIVGFSKPQMAARPGKKYSLTTNRSVSWTCAPTPAPRANSTLWFTALPLVPAHHERKPLLKLSDQPMGDPPGNYSGAKGCRKKHVRGWA